MLDSVHHLCPYLALADDGRSVVDGYDPDHACHAVRPPLAVDRLRQAQLCLTEAHPRCERFLAAQETLAAVSGRRPAPDLAFRRSRLVLHAEGGWRTRTRRPPRSTPRRGRGAVTGLLAALALTGVIAAAAISGGLTLDWLTIPGSSTPESTAPASQSPGATSSATPTAEPSLAPTASPLPSGSTLASPTPAASQLTYQVVAGDTLSSIAARFGTTVAAIMVANDITDPDSLTPGQILIIP